MSELQPLDWGFMELENADHRISLGIGAAAIIAGPAPTRAEFRTWLSERVGENVRLRQRVRSSPLDLTVPTWQPTPISIWRITSPGQPCRSRVTNLSCAS